MAKEKQMMRSTTDRWIGGVCGGLGDYFNIDPTVVRVVFFLLFWFGWGGALIYLALWIVLPQEPAADIGIVQEASQIAE
jgi:phage shock protein PspC (stress-responsive transcriptional regulator)